MKTIDCCPARVTPCCPRPLTRGGGASSRVCSSSSSSTPPSHTKVLLHAVMHRFRNSPPPLRESLNTHECQGQRNLDVWRGGRRRFDKSVPTSSSIRKSVLSIWEGGGIYECKTKGYESIEIKHTEICRRIEIRIQQQQQAVVLLVRRFDSTEARTFEVILIVASSNIAFFSAFPKLF